MSQVAWSAVEEDPTVRIYTWESNIWKGFIVEMSNHLAGSALLPVCRASGPERMVVVITPQLS